MSSESIFLGFLLLLCALFFLPKLVSRYFKVPYPLTEIAIGLVFALFLESYLQADLIAVLSTIGIITLFVHSGMDVDINFLSKNRSFFVVNVVRHLMVFFVIGFAMQHLFDVSAQVALLISLALITPSASYIISGFHGKAPDKRWISSLALTGEVVSILLLVLVSRWGDWLLMFSTLLVIVLLVWLLPLLLDYLYKKVFSKLIGTEFSFIFVVALLSAFVTEWAGLHYLVGAFIAGLVAERFLVETRLVEKGPNKKHILVGFGFFSATFVPFYFFRIGVELDVADIGWETALVALLLAVGVGAFRVGSIAVHRMLSYKERFWRSFVKSSKVLPTLVFTFVITEIIAERFEISMLLMNVLMLYGIFTAVVSLALDLWNGS